MSEAVIVALVGVIGVIGAALITAVGALAGVFWRRMIRAETNNHALWTYTRQLIDHIYRGGLGPPPEPPEHIRHLYEMETT